MHILYKHLWVGVCRSQYVRIIIIIIVVVVSSSSSNSSSNVVVVVIVVVVLVHTAAYCGSSVQCSCLFLFLLPPSL